MEIEQALREQIAKTPQSTAPVVLCFHGKAEVPEAELERHGFHVTEIQRVADECFVYGNVVLARVESLGDVPGIDVVSSAPDASIN